MKITPIPCLSDNYAYLVTCETTGHSAVVDPSEAAPVAEAVKSAGAAITAIRNTHHHIDHVGGNEALRDLYGVPVYGHSSDAGRIPALTEKLDEGSSFRLGDLDVHVFHIPGHTLGAVAYLVTSGAESAVFTGDTLFLSGCGRLFEGTAEQMTSSFEKLRALDPETRIYCGHEYTESNLKSAAFVEPGNDAIAEARAKASAKRAANQPTVPGTIREELLTNPFFRTDSPAIRATLKIAATASSSEAFGAIRNAKDSF